MARPPFDITPAALQAIAEIMRSVGRYEGLAVQAPQPRLRRQNRIRTVLGSVAIEGNTLGEEQVSALIEGKRVIGPVREVLEVQNAIAAYGSALMFDPASEKDLLSAHGVLMNGLLARAGAYRTTGVGVVAGSRIAHVAPPAKRVPHLVSDLLAWLRSDRETHPLVKASVVHYEIELIHPFADGNGRIGRLWQHVILARWHPVFEHVPFESIIHERQVDYYGALASFDRAGNATAFVEFALESLRPALLALVGDLRGERSTAAGRLEAARRALGQREFSRKEYIALIQNVSTATASRDLSGGVEQRLLARRGARALARYRFR